MEAITTLIRSLGPARLGAIGAVTLLVLAISLFAYTRATTSPMRPLFTDLEFDDSSAISRELDSLNVPYELRAEGAVILVPSNEVLRLRMALAENGLPAGGAVGYEIFDNGDGLGATSFVQNLNHLRALEGELARTIRTIDRIRFARVHLVLPERRLFQRENTEPSASIVLKLRGSLSTGQIRAIQHLAASAVKDLKPSRVSVVDDKGDLLASGTGDGAEVFASNLDERRISLEERLKQQVDAIVSSVVGPGNARVQVSADLESSRITDTRDVFDPDSRVLRSSQTREEETSSQGAGGSDGVSAGNELPGGGATGGAGSSGARESATTTEETVNYEISKQTTTEIREAGSVKKLSVAVLVDGLYSKDTNGETVYEPRPQEQIDQIATLVRSAVGFDRERGDVVEVVNLRFAPAARNPEFDETAGMGLDMSTADYLRLIELVLMALVGLILIMFVVRPLMRQAFTRDPAAAGQLPPPNLAIEGDAGDRAAGDGSGHQASLPAPGSEAPPPRYKVDDVIDGAKLTGEVQENAIRKVAELVKGNPDETVAIMRQWMQEGAR